MYYSCACTFSLSHYKVEFFAYTSWTGCPKSSALSLECMTCVADGCCHELLPLAGAAPCKWPGLGCAGPVVWTVT